MSGKGSRPRPFSISQQEFADNFDRIFGKNKMENTNEETKKTETCGCGRSPTGDCVGWHALTEEQYFERRDDYETGRVDLFGNEIK